MKSWALVCLFVCAVGFSGLSQAQTSDRITTSLYSAQTVALKGNVHGLAKPEFDLGRADTSRLVEGISLEFRPSASQQQDLDTFLKQLGDHSSPNYHKYLTPKQFGARFGLSQNDIDTVTAWLVSQGFANIKVANSRNRISFDGTIGQIESAFAVQMHSYLVDGVTHFANVGEPSVPAALGKMVIQVGHLHDFAPKPRAVKSHFTSYVSGNHFLSPADFATIYDLQPLYTAGIDGTGQKIAVVGQSTVSTTDLNNFRSAAGLPASTVTMTLAGGTATRCAGDEGESDLDLEWSGGVAKNAQIIFVYAGLNTGDSCTGNRVNSVWNALQYAVDNNVAPFISTSYGYCEAGLTVAFAGPGNTLEGWAKQGQTQGQTIVAATGDAGAADCDSGASATQGLAVDAPASLPEVTGAGGNEFCSTADTSYCTTGDTPTFTTNNPPGGDPPYWSAAGSTTDTISSALEYIPEFAWNDTSLDGSLSASGGGASDVAGGFYSKPAWQTGTGVPNDGARDVPDVSVTASADHDGYLICSEDNQYGACTAGFRSGAGGNLAIVGGTSAAAPTFSAVLALINQYLGNVPPTGLAPLNPTLYTLPGNNPNPFHDITTGNNIVPCTANTTGCPTSGQYGFSAGVGYDRVTGLGSIDANAFAVVMKRAPTTTTVSASASSVQMGTSVTFTASVVPATVTGTVNFYDNGSTIALGSGTLSSGTATFSSVLPSGSNSVVAVYSGDTSNRLSTSAPALVSVQGLTITPSTSSLAITAGHSASITITVSSSAQPVTFSCPNAPSGISCTFNPNGTTQTSVGLSIGTAPSLAAGTVPLTVSATGNGSSATTNITVNLAKTDQSFSLAPSATSYQVTAGGNATAIVTLTGTNGFNSQITYTCTDPAPESTCTGPVSAVNSSSPASFTITTTAPTARLRTPMERGSGIFFAMLFPGMLGVVFTAGSIRRRGVRLLGLTLMLGFATLWIASCGGSSGSTTKNAGTPAGAYTITVKATTGGASPITGQTTFTLNVQ